MKNIIVFANKRKSIKDLSNGAAGLAENVTLIYAGKREWACNAQTAYYLGDSVKVSVPELLEDIVKIAADSAADIALCDTTADGHLVASYLAVAMDAAVISDAIEVYKENDSLITSRMVYGGSAFKNERIHRGVICCSVGTFEGENELPVGEIIDINPTGNDKIHLVEKQEKQASSVNIAAAKKLIVVGRGVGDEEGMALVRKLAEAIGAEIGCTRPVVEELQLMSRETYVGVSGLIVSPDLLISVGVSGQVQHTVGTSQSGVIVAINKDKNAPIFQGCDYGIVGDLKVVIPDLLSRMKQ